MLYQYVAKDFSGEFVKGQIEAEDHRRALHLLREKDLFVVEIKRAQVQTSFSLFKRKVGSKDLALFCNQLSTMIDAGVPITRALDTVSEQTENKALKEATKDIIKEIESGNTLTESVKKHDHVFPQIFISLMEAGEMVVYYVPYKHHPVTSPIFVHLNAKFQIPLLHKRGM